MTIDPRLIRNQTSVRNLELLLQTIIKDPCEYTKAEDIKLALRSQGSLSKLRLEFQYNSEYKVITSSSTNTVKRIANDIFEEGFGYLDSLRVRAKTLVAEAASLESKEKPSSRKKLSDQVTELQELLQISRQDCWNLAAAFRKACDHARRYADATGDKTIIAKCTKELKELKGMLSLLKDPTSSN